MSRMTEVNTPEEWQKYFNDLKEATGENKVTIGSIIEILNSLDLSVSKIAFTDYQNRINEFPVNRSAVQKEVDIFDRTLRNELSTKWFKYLSAEQATLYQAVDLFGMTVKGNFPSAEREIIEAGRCLALERGTATVFHCMRILEVGLNALAKDLHVDFANRNWENVIADIEKAIKDIPKDRSDRPLDWKEQLHFYSEAAVHFRFVKDAWRNYAMHLHNFYTVEDAGSIFRHVNELLIELAARLKE